MALYYVNDSLITDEMVGESSWPSGETYKRYMIRSIPFLKKMDDGCMRAISSWWPSPMMA